METVTGKTFDAERAFYNADGLTLNKCRFEGPADGESALKEGKNITVNDCYFALRYPFWHDSYLKIKGCTLTEDCRAALWYSNHIDIAASKLDGIKALRECSDIRLQDTEIISPEFGWNSHHITMENVTAISEYFLMRCDHLILRHMKFTGKYSFQYTHDVILENCELDTKDAFWHAENVVCRNCTIKGEYLAWYSRNITFENCTIIGTQPLCYCKNLRLINCKMIDTDLAFERSEVQATLTVPILSIKNPLSGTIEVPHAGQIIMDIEEARGVVIETE